MATEQDRNKALVLQMYDEVWNKGNIDYINVAVSPEFKDHPPKRFVELPDRGRDALSESAATLRAAVLDYHDQMIQVVVEGDRVCYVGRITGTHTQPFLQMPASGNAINMLGITEYRLQDGKIVERWGILDGVGLIALASAPGH